MRLEAEALRARLAEEARQLRDAEDRALARGELSVADLQRLGAWQARTRWEDDARAEQVAAAEESVERARAGEGTAQSEVRTAEAEAKVVKSIVRAGLRGGAGGGGCCRRGSNRGLATASMIPSSVSSSGRAACWATSVERRAVRLRAPRHRHRGRGARHAAAPRRRPVPPRRLPGQPSRAALAPGARRPSPRARARAGRRRSRLAGRVSAPSRTDPGRHHARSAHVPGAMRSGTYVSARLLYAAGQRKDAAARTFDAARGSAVDGGRPCPLACTRVSRRRRLPEGRRSRAPPSTAQRGGPVLHRARRRGPHRSRARWRRQGHAAVAIPRWRAALAKNPKAWIDVALPLASALLDGAGGDADALEARDISLTRVIVEAPRIAESSGAEGLRKRAVARLATHDAKTPRELTPAQRAQQARVWLDAGESEQGRGAVDGARSRTRRVRPTTRPVYCSASIVRAQALGRTKGWPGTALGRGHRSLRA